jgi:hypothetical protein
MDTWSAFKGNKRAKLQVLNASRTLNWPGMDLRDILSQKFTIHEQSG